VLAHNRDSSREQNRKCNGELECAAFPNPIKTAVGLKTPFVSLPHKNTTGMIHVVKYWEIIADNLSKPVGVGAAFQVWIPTGEQSSLRTRITATESASLCVLMKNSPRLSNSNRRFGVDTRGRRTYCFAQK
jgi:hypothetical protein